MKNGLGKVGNGPQDEQSVPSRGGTINKQKAIEILEELRARAAALKPPLNTGSPEYVKWRSDVESAIWHVFPNERGFLEKFRDIQFTTDAYRSATRPGANERMFSSGVEKTSALLESMITEIKNFWKEPEATNQMEASRMSDEKSSRPSAGPVVPDPRVVFVVHGRNEAVRKSMFDFLRAIGLKPLEWSQALSATEEGTPYVGQALDTAFSRAQAVVVLMTPDDEARLKEEFLTEGDADHERRLTGQARPNVLFEAGMAMGRDAKRTVLVEVGNLRPFSDVAGRHILRLNNSSERRQDLADRLKNTGCAVDLSGRDWHTNRFICLGVSSPYVRKTYPSGHVESA